MNFIVPTMYITLKYRSIKPEAGNQQKQFFFQNNNYHSFDFYIQRNAIIKSYLKGNLLKCKNKFYELVKFWKLN